MIAPHAAPAPPAPQLLGRDGVLALAVVTIVFLLQLPFLLRGVSMIDEGSILYMADGLLNGRRLYSDETHLAFPGVHWLTAAAFVLGGSSFASARTLGAVLFALLVGTMFLVGRWFLGRRGALALVVLFLCYRVWAYPHWHMVSYSSLSVGLVLAAMWALGEAFAGRAAWPYVLAGAFAGAALVAKQDSGALGLVALGLGVLLSRATLPALGHRVIAFAGGAALVIGAAAVAILSGGIARDFWADTVVAPLYNLRHFAYPGRPPLRPLLAQDATLRGQAYAFFPPILLDLHWQAITQSAVYRTTGLVDAMLKLVYVVPWLVFLPAAALALRRRLRDAWDLPAARELLLLLVVAAFILAFNRPQDWIHLFVLLPPTLLLGVLLLARLLAWTDALRRPLLAAGALGLALATGISVTLALQLRRHFDTPVRTARGLVYTTAAQAAALEGVVDWAAAAPPGAPLAAYPYHPLLNYVTGRRAIDRYQVVWPIDPDPGREERIVRDLAAAPDALVAYSATQWPHFPRFAHYAPNLFRHLVDHFTIDRVAGGDADGFTFLLLRPASDRPPAGESLLGAPLDAAAIVVEPREGGPRSALPAERDDLAGEALWPFQRVLRVTTLPGAAVAVVYRLVPKLGDRLEIAYGINPDHWLDFPPPTARFNVWVAADGRRDEMLLAEVEPRRRAIDRRWATTAIRLTPWAGRPVEITLRVTGPRGRRRATDVAGFGDPRIVHAPG